MVLYPLLNHDDLRRWRACSRRFWLYRRNLQLAATSTKVAHAEADERAEAAVVYGPGGCEFVQQCVACKLPVVPDVSDPLARLEIVGHDVAAELRAAGHTDLHSVTLQDLHNARQRRAVRAIQQGAPVLEPEVAALMRALPYPRHSLRFDTIGFAVPLWAGTRPYQVLPFQWTCEVLQADGQSVRHSFLADAQGGDPRRAFAVSLLQVLGDHGAVLAYNAGFERNRILDLARLFDDLAPALEALLARLVDLFQIARAHYYHPVMAGSWSFKSISRAVAPDVSLTLDDTLAPTVQAAFAQSLQRGLYVQTREQLRAALQGYGQQQTEVLRRMATLFEGAADAPTPDHRISYPLD